MSMLDATVMQDYIKMCDDAWLQGWHERNAGNITYRMSEEEVEECEIYFEDDGEWVEMGVTAENLAGEYFLVTGAGKFFRNVSLDAEDCVGVIEINDAGDSYRIVWGLSGGAKPTSELPSHILNHSIKKEATEGRHRIIYHAHPPAIIAMTFVTPLTAKDFSGALWRTISECPIVFPAGVGVVGWMLPGGTEVAEETCELMKTFDAVVWAHHGMFVSGEDFDSAFSLMHTIEKSADIYLRALSAGVPILQKISDEALRSLAGKIGIENFNESLLD